MPSWSTKAGTRSASWASSSDVVRDHQARALLVGELRIEGKTQGGKELKIVPEIVVARTSTVAHSAAGHSRREVVDAALGIISKMEPLIASGERDAYAALWQSAFGKRARALGLLAKADDSDDDGLLRVRWVGRVVHGPQ